MCQGLRGLLAVAVLMGVSGVLHAQEPAPAPGPQKSWEDLGVDDAIPDHAPKKREAGAKDDGAPQKEKDRSKAAAAVDPANAAEGEPGGRVPWTTALQGGLVTATTIVVWGLVALPLGLIPFAGMLAQFAGLTMPFLSSGLGWAFLQKYRNVRAPLRAMMISGAIQCSVDLCCLLPLIITPLAPVVCLSRCFIDACINGISTTILLRMFGRMKVPGEAELNWDLLETPPAQSPEARQDPGYGKPGRTPGKASPSDSFLAPAPTAPAQPGAPRAPSAEGEEGTTVK